MTGGGEKIPSLKCLEESVKNFFFQTDHNEKRKNNDRKNLRIGIGCHIQQQQRLIQLIKLSLSFFLSHLGVFVYLFSSQVLK